MSELTTVIPILRDSAVAVLRIHMKRPPMTKKGKQLPAEFQLSFGSGFCVLEDRYIVTAFHVLKDGQERIANDQFYVFAVPGNGPPAYHFPVVGFPLEAPELDLAVLEIGPCAIDGVHHIPAIPISFSPKSDGTHVVTVGYPAPEIAGANIDPNGNFHGGQFFLKSHANEGIVSAQYSLGALHVYELNVGWHHGESGGLIASVEDRAVFSIMQQYRNVQSPYGTVAGPHRGVALSAIEEELLGLGVAGV